MAVSHQSTPTFSFSSDAPAVGVGEDDLLRAQVLLGGGRGQGDHYYDRRPWEAESGALLRRPAYAPAPAPTVARYREEMMDMVRRGGTVTGGGGGDGGGGQEQMLYELSLRDLVELPSAASALREGTDHPGDNKSPAPGKEMGESKKGKSSRKRDVFRRQNLESGVFMLKMFSFLPGVLGGGSSEKQRRKERLAAAAAARSKVTPAPKAAWTEEDKCDEEKSVESWEKRHGSSSKASRSSSGSSSEKSTSSSPRRKTRRFSGCYSFLHHTTRR